MPVLLTHQQQIVMAINMNLLRLLALLLFMTSSAYASTYYVSNSGDDSNNGLSASYPFKTLSKVSSVMLTGDTILLDAGSKFNETFNVVVGSINIDVYGTGDLPVISGSDRYLTWTFLGSNLYSTTPTNDVYVVEVNGSLGKKENLLANVNEHGDWLYDSGELVIYLDDSPFDIPIELGQRDYGINLTTKKNFINISNIEISGFNYRGIYGWNNDNINITNVVIKNGGGKTGSHGIGFFGSSDYLTVDSISAYDLYADGIYLDTVSNVLIEDSDFGTVYNNPNDNVQFVNVTGYEVLNNKFNMEGTNSPKGNFISHNGSGGVVRGNVFNGGQFGVSIGDNNSVVEYNLTTNHIAGSEWFSGISVSVAVDNVRIENNLSINDNRCFYASDTSKLKTNIKYKNNYCVNYDNEAIELHNVTSGEIKNNHIVSFKPITVPILKTVSSLGTTDIDYNLYYPEQTGFVDINGTTYNTLSAYQTAESMDLNSSIFTP